MGKGVSCIVPFLLRCPESVVCIDFKGENARLTAEARRKMGHKVILDKLGANPATRTQVLQLLKQLDPRVVIPELDAAKPINDKLAVLERQLADERKARADEKAEREEIAQEPEGEERRRPLGVRDRQSKTIPVDGSRHGVPEFRDILVRVVQCRTLTR